MPSQEIPFQQHTLTAGKALPVVCQSSKGELPTPSRVAEVILRYGSIRNEPLLGEPPSAFGKSSLTRAPPRETQSSTLSQIFACKPNEGCSSLTPRTMSSTTHHAMNLVGTRPQYNVETVGRLHSKNRQPKDWYPKSRRLYPQPRLRPKVNSTAHGTIDRILSPRRL
ncbi:hypothetical protein P153DRAFT_156149 [Dothidotthia symphoricarpi CBS 119687]|uniref:Uncharacterized protein n=1 Tax=Dothidotthia symphoricarpi CBS 119687 TaxID=1392245 RepID=A0A6A6ARC2_9PLEO|nr:uncharacterized protein P153DRAFT_156149 [Dothidotthia symphoricarpi CBS 119687]KAF2133387.1 hypothetical protein P153DRAFT_156149 [Dothidotthia symphoricarpi CBS 119687]